MRRIKVSSAHLGDDFSENNDHGLIIVRFIHQSGMKVSLLHMVAENRDVLLTVETRTAAIPPPNTLSKKIGSDSLTICPTAAHKRASDQPSPQTSLDRLGSIDRSSAEIAGR